MRYEQLALHQPALDLFRDAPAELIDRPSAGSLFFPRFERFGGLRLDLGLGFPDLNQTRFALAVRVVLDDGGLNGPQALRGLRIGEDGTH